MKTNAWWMAEFATLIYESEDKISEVIKKITNNDLSWLKDEKTSTAGVVATFDEFIVVSFRGTELMRPSEIFNVNKIRYFLEDFFTNINFIDGSKLKNVGVHKGIHEALNSVWEQLLLILSNENEDKPIWFTGHSLGGALAIMAAFKWDGNPDNIGGSLHNRGASHRRARF